MKYKRRYAKVGPWRIIVWPGNFNEHGEPHLCEFHMVEYVGSFDGSGWAVRVRGAVKWDGCIDFLADPTCKLHGCCIQDVKDYGDAVTRAYELCAEELQNYGMWDW